MLGRNRSSELYRWSRQFVRLWLKVDGRLPRHCFSLPCSFAQSQAPQLCCSRRISSFCPISPTSGRVFPSHTSRHVLLDGGSLSALRPSTRTILVDAPLVRKRELGKVVCSNQTWSINNTFFLLVLLACPQSEDKYESNVAGVLVSSCCFYEAFPRITLKSDTPSMGQ